MKLNRRTKTLIYLLTATFLSWINFRFFVPDMPSSFISLFLGYGGVLLLFGIALVISNRRYLRKRMSMVYIPGCFILYSFLIGWCIYRHADTILGHYAITALAGCISSFLLVTVIMRQSFILVRIGVSQLLMLLIFPFIGLAVISYFNVQSVIDFQNNGLNYHAINRMLLCYQILMTIMVVSMLKDKPGGYYGELTKST